MNATFRMLGSVLLLVSLTTPALAKEVTVRRSDLPPAVAATLDQRYPGAQVLGYSRETDRDGVRYEAEMRVRGQHVDALFGPRGKWLGDETEIRFADVPAPVKKAFEWYTARGYHVEKTEKLADATRKGLRYEVLARAPGGLRELVFEASGKLVHSEARTQVD